MTADYRDDEWSAKGSQYHSWCTAQGVNDTRFEHGAIITEYGIVEATIWVGCNCDLKFVYNQKVHARSFDKAYSRRGLITKAKQFAREIVQSQ